MLCVSVPATGAPPFPTLVESGVSEQRSEYGAYYLYEPQQLGRDTRIAVLAHGSLTKGRSARELASRFIRRWTKAADQHNLILVAPAFDATNFQTYGGYRGLFGRKVGADTFVLAITEGLAKRHQLREPRIWLYGHSAGGQFAIRLSVRHADRIARVVASAPGRYAFPTTAAPWPYGAGALSKTVTYRNPKLIRRLDVRPNLNDWLHAAQLPITVVVGAQDLDPQPARPGHRGRNRVELAHQWAQEMNELAGRNHKSGQVTVTIVPNVGHNSRRLTPRSIAALFPRA